MRHTRHDSARSMGDLVGRLRSARVGKLQLPKDTCGFTGGMAPSQDPPSFFVGLLASVFVDLMIESQILGEAGGRQKNAGGWCWIRCPPPETNPGDRKGIHWLPLCVVGGKRLAS